MMHFNNIMRSMASQIAKFMGPTWGPPGSCWTQMNPMLAPWNLLSGLVQDCSNSITNALQSGTMLSKCDLTVVDMGHVHMYLITTKDNKVEIVCIFYMLYVMATFFYTAWHIFMTCLICFHQAITSTNVDTPLLWFTSMKQNITTFCSNAAKYHHWQWPH